MESLRPLLLTGKKISLGVLIEADVPFLFRVIYGTAIIKFDVLYLILVLLFVLVSIAFIYWRLSTMISDPTSK